MYGNIHGNNTTMRRTARCRSVVLHPSPLYPPTMMYNNYYIIIITIIIITSITAITANAAIITILSSSSASVHTVSYYSMNVPSTPYVHTYIYTVYIHHIPQFHRCTLEPDREQPAACCPCFLFPTPKRKKKRDPMLLFLEETTLHILRLFCTYSMYVQIGRAHV